MRDKTLISDFTRGNIPRQLVTFATPLFLSSLLQVVYNMVDMVVVGQAMGKVGLSAVAVGGDVSNVMTFIGMGFCNAGQIIISQYIGAGKRDRLGRFVGTMFTSLMSYAALTTVLCLLLRRPLLELMNAPPEAMAEALSYSTICMSGLLFIYGYNICSSVLRGLGNSRHPFIFVAIAAVMNMILDLIFVLGFDMGAGGAALATVISQGTSFICCAVFLHKNRHRSGLELKVEHFVKLDRAMLADLVKLGIPMAIKSASIQFSRLFVNSWINSYGVAISAFAGIANKLNTISNLISNSMNTAGSSMVGQNIGAKQYDRVPRIVLWVMVCTFSVAAVLSAAVVFFPNAVFSIFTQDPAVLEVAMGYLPIAVMIFFGSACRAPMNALINGSGNVRLNFVTAILDGIVMRIGLSILFGLTLDMRHTGFWLGDALAGFTPFFIGIVFYFTGRWKKSDILDD